MRFFFVSRRLRAESFQLETSDPDEWVMAVDTDRCIACGACELACRIEHRGDLEAAGAPHPITVSGPDDGNGGRMLCLPHGCRQCPDPCEGYDPYNFWSICPSSTAKASIRSFCDTCEDRLEQGQWPACATRCT